MGQTKSRGTREERIKKLHEEFGVRPMSRERFNAFVSWTRSPIATGVSKELEWFADENEHVLGLAALDRTDRDFAYVVLGRDEKGRFRCIDVNASYQSLNEARRHLFISMKQQAQAGSTVFPQGDTDKAGVDLFTPIVATTKLNDIFKLVATGDHWYSARSMLSEMMRHFVDIDGNFVEQFQTSGFDARLWELYLYAFLLEEGLFVERPEPAPDFSVRYGRKKIFIEAVTVNPTDGEITKAALNKGPFFRDPNEVAELLKGKMPIKFGSALFSKLNRKTPYWNLPHVAGSPLVFAIADFHEPQSMTWSSSALFQYLYAVSHDFFHDESGQLVISTLNLETHEHNGKKIPSGFFFLPDAENVSAVLFTASGTLSKFNRMGRLAGFGVANSTLIRRGVCHEHSHNASVPRPFVNRIEPGLCSETWAEGVSMYHNPNAKHPVPPDAFPSIAHHWFEDGEIKSVVPKFHPYNSMTINIVATDNMTE